MILSRIAVCSEVRNKPVTRGVCDTRAEAEALLQRLKATEPVGQDIDYWLAELGPECEAWRWLSNEEGTKR